MFTLAFGHPRFAEMAMGLGRSLKLIGDTTPRAVLTDIDGFPWERAFDIVIRRKVPPQDIWWSKLYAREETDAKRILFLDGDCLAFKRLDPIFEAFAGAPFGVQGVLKSEGEWYGPDISEVAAKAGVPGMVQFNGGLMYYEPGPELDRLVEEAKRISAEGERYGWRLSRGVPADEVCLSLAMATTGLGRHVPDESDFSNSAVGLVGPLRMDVMRRECNYICRRHNLQYVEPFVFHAHFYSKFLIYWKQLETLKRLEDYEQNHPFGYMAPTHKLRRSLEKRILKLRNKL